MTDQFSELHEFIATERRRELHRDIARSKRLIAVAAQKAPGQLPGLLTLIRDLEARAKHV